MVFTKVMLHLKNFLFFLLYVGSWFYALAFDKQEGWFLVYFFSIILILSLTMIFPSLKPWKIQLSQVDEVPFTDCQPIYLRFMLTKPAANKWCYPFLKVGIDFEKTDEGFEEMIYPFFKKEEVIYFQKLILTRGCYQQNTLLLEAGDPFGLIVKYKKLELEQPILVYPAYIETVTEQLVKKMVYLKPSFFQKKELSDFHLKNIRPYRSGDPTQHIDWKTSSKQQVLYIKEYEQENKQQSYAVYFYGIPHSTFETTLAACYSVYCDLKSNKAVSLHLVGSFDHEDALIHDQAGFAKIKPLSNRKASLDLLKEAATLKQHVIIFTPSLTSELKEFVRGYSGKEALLIILTEEQIIEELTLNCHIITIDLANSNQKNAL